MTMYRLRTDDGYVSYDMQMEDGRVEWTVDSDFGDLYPRAVAVALAEWYRELTGIGPVSLVPVEVGQCARCGRHWDPHDTVGPHVCRADSVGQRAFAALAGLRPHEAHAADPDRFWSLYHARFPLQTRADMEQLLRETDGAIAEGVEA